MHRHDTSGDRPSPWILADGRIPGHLIGGCPHILIRDEALQDYPFNACGCHFLTLIRSPITMRSVHAAVAATGMAWALLGSYAQEQLGKLDTPFTQSESA